MSVRVRFAPSPTGYLHIGGARTALFNWLYAKHTGGTFVLRIEDTDEARNSSEAIQVILDSLRWLGLHWDEGPLTADPADPGRGDRTPYFQSRRGEIYQRYVQKLLDSGMAYPADGAIKFRMLKDPILIPDLVVGTVERKLTDREAIDPDFVIVRSDGKPVFHLVNVIDDLEMGITHVIRGEDHLSNTSKHIKLFEALGASPPVYAHIPLILNSNGSKMSKRDEGASLTSYMNGGFIPSAIVNFLCLLGWSSKDNQEIFSIPELIQRFSIDGILRSNSRFDMNKLMWMNSEYIKSIPLDQLVQSSWPFLVQDTPQIAEFPQAYSANAIHICREKVKSTAELPEFCRFFFQDQLDFLAQDLSSQLNISTRPVISAALSSFQNLEIYSPESVNQCIHGIAEALSLKPGKVMGPLRLALTASKAGPGVTEIIVLMGKDRVLRNLSQAISFLDSQG